MATSSGLLALYQAEVRAFDVRTGTMRWRWHAPTVVYEHAVGPTHLYAVVEHTIHALSLETGRVDATLTVAGSGLLHPVVAGERLAWMTSSSNGPAHLWSALLDALASCTSRPLSADMSWGELHGSAGGGRLVASRYRGSHGCVSLVDLEGGEVLWDFGGDFAERRSPNVLDILESVVVVRQGAEVVGLELATGRELWRGPGVGTASFGRAGPQRLVRVSRARRGAPTNIVTIDVETGTEVDDLSLKLVDDHKLIPGETHLLVHDDVLWVRSGEASLVGIASRDGTTVELQPDPFASDRATSSGLVALDGHLIISADDGLVAFGYEGAVRRA